MVTDRATTQAGFSTLIVGVSLLEPLFEALNRAEVRYVVVGGVATVLHGFARLTAGVDLVVDLVPTEARKAMETLVGLGLRPRPAVDPVAFADSVVRESWIRDKGMRVFSLWDPRPRCRTRRRRSGNRPPSDRQRPFRDFARDDRPRNRR